MSGILLPAKCCCGQKPFTCQSPYIAGCNACSCCGARYYIVCISGAAGDAAVINSGVLGWTLYNGGSGGSYRFDNGMVRIALELTTTRDLYLEQWGGLCNTWTLNISYHNGNGWVEVLAASGGGNWYEPMEFPSLGRQCDIVATKNGIRFEIRPKETWSVSKLRFTMSGYTACSTTCSRPGNFYCKVHHANLDGIYDVPLAETNPTGDGFFRMNDVGSFSYSGWPTGDCSGTPAFTVSKGFNIEIRIHNNSHGPAVSVFVTQGLGLQVYEFYSWYNFTPDDMCKTLSVTNLTQVDNRCPISTGDIDQNPWVRVGNNGTATITGIP